MYIITVRRITSGELLKLRKGLSIDGSYRRPRPSSSRFGLTLPFSGLAVAVLILGATPSAGDEATIDEAPAKIERPMIGRLV